MNNFQNDLGIFCSGILIGWVILALLLIFTQSYHQMARDAIRECERNLPRNQSCIVIGVVTNEPRLPEEL